MDRRIKKFIDDEVKRFDLRINLSKEEINNSYFSITNLDEEADCKTVEDRLLYLYEYLLNDMTLNNEITQVHADEYYNNIKKQIKEMEYVR